MIAFSESPPTSKKSSSGAAHGRLQYFLPDLRHRPRDAIAVRRIGFGCSDDIGAFVLDVDLIHGHERAQVQLGTG